MLNLKDGTLWQWDTGRKILITVDEGSTIDKVQLYNGLGGHAREAKIEVDGEGNKLAAIPDPMLQFAGNLSVYLMTTDADGLKTTETVVMRVNPRAKPEDYVFTDEEVRTYQVYDDRLKVIEADYVTEEELAGAKQEANSYTDRVVNEQVSEVEYTANQAYTMSTEAKDTANTAETIAKGRNRAHVFTTTIAMQAWLADEANKGTCMVGDNLYIVDVGVPDWWIAEILEEVDVETGYYFKIAQLETQKVDLTEIIKLLGNTDISGIADGTVTGAIAAQNSNLTLALTYNENTDYFGTTYNGEWRDVFFAGFQLYYIYADGNEFTDKTGGWTASGYSPNSYHPVGGTVSKLENGISLFAGEVTGNERKVVIVGTENAVDLSNHNKLYVSYNWGGEDSVMELDISSVSSGYVSISMDNSSYDNGQSHVIDACVYTSSAKEYIWENRLTSNATRKVYASNLASMLVKKVWLE